ncbi:MAG: DUF4232 domain-containing protein [Solirubrobacterales bacterium]
MAVRRAISIVVLVAVVLAGCGGGGRSGGVPTVGKAPRTTRGGRRAAPPGEPRPPTPKMPLASTPRCDPAKLVVFHEGGGGGALSTFYTTFTVGNLTRRACTTAGYPRLVALGADGRPIGGPARRGRLPSESTRRLVRIPAERTATFRASWSENDFGPGECRPTVVARYRVLLPGDRRPQLVPFPDFERCTNAATRRSFTVGRIEREPPPRNHPRHEPPRLREPGPHEHLPRCRSGQLLLYTGLDATAGVGLGTEYFRLDVANLSDRACRISGTPGVVAVARDGATIGQPASEGAGVAVDSRRHPLKVAKLAAHSYEGAAVMLSTGSVFNFSPGFCHFKIAAGLRVTLPGLPPQTVPMQIRRCRFHPRGSGGGQLSVGPIE